MIEKVKICSIVNDLGVGGTARQLVTIDKYLNKDFFEHLIISLGSQDNARVKYLDDQRIFFVNNVSEVIDAIKANQVNVAYFHRHGRPEKLHDAIALAMPDNVLMVELNTFSVFDPGAFGRRRDLQIFVSRTNLLKYLRQNKLPFNFNIQKVVHGLVDLSNFKKNLPTDKEKSEYRKKYGLDGFFVIGRLARPVLGKWDDRIFIFWKHLCYFNKKIKFIIYGVPEEKRKILLESGLADNLIILEKTCSDKELSLFYETIDTLVHLSPIGECSCGAIAESMLFGKSIVVTSTPFPKHVFFRTHTKDNGQIEQIKNCENGYVVNSALAMAKAVDYLSKNVKLRERMGATNQFEIANKYDVVIGIRTLEKAFIEGLRRKNQSVSQQLLDYASGLSYYPTKDDIETWFLEYKKRLNDLYSKRSFNFFDQLYYIFLILLRKIKSFIRIINRI